MEEVRAPRSPENDVVIGENQIPSVGRFGCTIVRTGKRLVFLTICPVDARPVLK